MLTRLRLRLTERHTLEQVVELDLPRNPTDEDVDRATEGLDWNEADVVATERDTNVEWEKL